MISHSYCLFLDHARSLLLSFFQVRCRVRLLAAGANARCSLHCQHWCRAITSLCSKQHFNEQLASRASCVCNVAACWNVYMDPGKFLQKYEKTSPSIYISLKIFSIVWRMCVLTSIQKPENARSYLGPTFSFSLCKSLLNT